MPDPKVFKRKCLALLTDIRGDWFINNIHNTKHPMNYTILSKKQ